MKFNNNVMKKTLVILFAILFGTTQAKAYNFELNGLYYNFIEGTVDFVEVTYPIEYRHDDYDGEGDYYGDIVIPEVVTYKNKQYYVVGIGEQAFRESGVETVTIPKSIEHIGVLAFRSCYSLNKIEVQWDIPLNLREVEKRSPADYTAEDIFDFSEQEFERITLVVPKGTKHLYQEQDVWSRFINIEEKKSNEELLLSPQKIAILDGTVTLELRKGVDFPCIGLQLADKNINMGLGTYLEIKKSGEFYLMEYRYKLKQYNSIDKAVEEYLKDLFENFYDNKDKKYGKKVWAAFVQEGGLKHFLEIAKQFIDDEFLNSPFNETYG